MGWINKLARDITWSVYIYCGSDNLDKSDDLPRIEAEITELIVKAVNQYDHVAELVEAAKEMYKAIGLITDVNDRAADAIEPAELRLRSALAKMEVQP